MTMLVAQIAVKASLVIAAAVLINGAARKRSAAARHLVWVLAVVALLMLPVVSTALPAWSVAIPIAPRSAGAADSTGLLTATEEAGEPGFVSARPDGIAFAGAAGGRLAPGVESPWSWAPVLPLLYLAGVFALLARLAAERRAVSGLARRAVVVTDEAWQRLLTDCAGSVGYTGNVRLLRSLERSMPMAFGTLTPSIVIPSIADTWSDDRRRAVLLHELAHIARRDCLTQLLAAVACAVYWVHPGVWWVVRRLRVERELACDDRVLAAGAAAREYAEHLLELAFSLGGYRAPALVVSMARPRQVEGRMLAVLDQTRNRTIPTRLWRLVCGAIAVVALLPLASARAVLVAAPSGAAPAALEQNREEDAPAREAAEQRLPGTWELRTSRNSDVVYLRMSEAPDSSTGRNLGLGQLSGLSRAMLSGSGGQVQFALRRDAGTFTFDGAIRVGVGAGTYTFAPSATFPDAMVKRGFARPSAADQYLLAQQDIGFAFLDELDAQRYTRPDLAQLVNAGRHGVDRTYVREMGALGYRLGAIDGLGRLRDHGVSAEYVRDLAAQGLSRLSADDLVRARDHGISPEYVKELKVLGYQVTMAELVAARDHGVSPEYVRGLAAQGYENVSLTGLITARDHGISPEYAAELRALGFHFTLDDLIKARDHGIDARFLQQIGSRSTGLTMDQIVALKDRGPEDYRFRLKKVKLEWYFKQQVRAFHQWVRSWFPA